MNKSKKFKPQSIKVPQVGRRGITGEETRRE